METEIISMYKHIYFNNISDQYPKRKTQTWECYSNTDVLLGEVKWHSPWRQYCFFVRDDVFFSVGCMDSMVNFIEQLKEARIKQL